MGLQRATCLSAAVASVVVTDVKTPAPFHEHTCDAVKQRGPSGITALHKPSRFCPTQSFCIFQQLQFITFEWNKFFHSETASSSASQRSDSLLKDQVTQNAPFLFCGFFCLFACFLNKQNKHYNYLIRLSKFIFLLTRFLVESYNPKFPPK